MRAHIFIVSLAAALVGCARTPPGVSTGSQTLVTLEAQVSGRVDPAGYYYFIIDTDDNATTGPNPVTGPPWGNGYAAGSYTHYVLFHNGRFDVFESPDNPNHLENRRLGQPLQAAVQRTGDGRNESVVVQLDRSQLATVNRDVRVLNVNVIATDRVPLDPQDVRPKVVDGLGATGGEFVTIPLTSTATYINGPDSAFGTPEGPRDVPGLAENPSLDIVNWRVTVQTNG